MVSSWISPKAYKGVSSRTSGRGLFATEQISAGEIVAVKGGHIVTTTQLRELPDPLPNSEIQIADGLHLVAVSPEEYEPVMLFINHSCEPNVGFAGNIVLVAMRELIAGENHDGLCAVRRLRRTNDLPLQHRFLPARDRRARLAATRPTAEVPRVLLVVPRRQNHRNAR